MMMQLDQVPESLRFKSYMLPVPSDMRRARQAVAWTWDIPEDEYEPQFQS